MTWPRGPDGPHGPRRPVRWHPGEAEDIARLYRAMTEACHIIADEVRAGRRQDLLIHDTGRTA